MLSRKNTLWKWSLAGAAMVLGLSAVGCGEGTGTGPGDGEGFISDSPFGGNNQNGGEDASADGSGGGATATGEPTADDGGGEKVIQEADIIQVDGNKLYALSQYGGLSIVDMANPANLKVIGHHDIQGVPFEMYLRDGVVYAMFSSFGQWQCDAEYTSCEYVSSSHIEALDVTSPAAITKIGSFDLPGEISDSRIVGDYLYAVSYENGYCWNCADAPTTTVTSIDVGDPADIAVVDSVAFDSSDPYGYGWGRRSVTVTQDRMFIAGIEWDGNSDGHSTIQIVDITDPDGSLHVGAAIEAAGMIESRWQMDEHQGVLRVVSQPGVWWTNGVPQVQTFQINSSDSVAPLATLDMVLPMPERLRSARFDGTRLYVITAEQTDPLFTLDLSNPSQPLQVGELEIPGWSYHLEPRGDRVFALGFDPQNPGGSMNVSLFDVSNYAAPALVERIAFGGDWSWAPEDQDRIHKAFKIDSDLGAIFVPFGAYEYDENDGYYGCGHVDSGIQIIDFTQDSLTKRGFAPMHGFARRALIHGGKLFSVSDSEVGAFDITNRDAPALVDTVALSNYVNQSIRVGNNLVRVAADWWTNASTLDVVPAGDPERTEPLGSLDLKDVVGSDDASDCYGWGYFYGAQLFALDATRVALAWSTYNWYEYAGVGGPVVGTHVVIVDLSNPAAPVVQGKLSMPFAMEGYGWWGSLDGGKAVVKVGDRLVFRRIQSAEYGSNLPEQAWLEIVDVGGDGDPAHVSTVTLPDGNGHSLLVKNGIHVLTSHWEPVAGQPGKVKFYLDRVNVPAAGLGSSVTSLNVPGALLSYDDASSHALTVDFQHKQVGGLTAEQCYEQFGWNAWYDYTPGIGMCHHVQQSLKLVDVTGGDVDLLDTEPLDPKFYVYTTNVTESRVFATGYAYTNDATWSGYTVMVVGDIGDDEIQSATHQLAQEQYLWPVASEGDHLVMTSWDLPGIHVLDAADLDGISVEKKGDVSSYVYAVTLDGDQALCSLGPYGLEVVDLD